jgi:hypothetical protein
MSFLYAAVLVAQAEEVTIDAAEEGKKIITGMAIVGLVFIAVIALGQLSKWLGHRRESRRPPAY